MQFQPHLGREFKDNYKPQDRLNFMSLAKVIKVHHKHYTADVQLIKTNDTIRSSEESEGKYSAKILTQGAHFDDATIGTSGVMYPIREGQLVVVAFLDGVYTQPIIIGSIHNNKMDEFNILPNRYPLRPESSLEDMRETMKYLNVHPSQFYTMIDGIGAVEMSHPSKTFLKIDPDLYSEISDEHGGFDHQHLTERDPMTYRPRSAKTENTAYPVKMLFNYRTSFEDTDTTWTKFFLNSDGMFRVTRDTNDEAITYQELGARGEYKVRRQLDSSKHGEGKDFVELVIEETGRTTIKRSVDGNESRIEISELGDIALENSTDTYVRVTVDGDINLRADGELNITTENGRAFPVLVSSEEPPNPKDGLIWLDTSIPTEVPKP